MSTAVTRDAEGTVTGNTYDKYGSTNPVVRRLMAGFERSLEELFAQADPSSLLDVGCGEAVLTHKWAQRLAPRRVVGIDLEDPSIQAEWEKRQAPNLDVPRDEGREPAVRRLGVRRRDRDRGARARARPGPHGGRDGPRGRALAARLGAARAAVAHAQRRARRLRQGPRQHPRARQPLVQALVRGACSAATARSSRRARRSRGRCCSSGSEHSLGLPPRRRRPATAAAPASSRSGSRLTGVVTFAYFSVASYVLDDVAYKQISLLWSVLFVIVSVIYRPIEQLLSRTIADRRARGLRARPSAAHAADPAGELRARVPRASRWRCAGRSRTTCSTARRRCTGSSSSRCSPTRRATSRAAGSPATSGSASTAGSCSSRRSSRLAFAVAVAVGIAEGQSAVALGMAAAPFVSLVVVPWAFSRRPPAAGAQARRGRRSASAAAGASRSRCWP